MAVGKFAQELMTGTLLNSNKAINSVTGVYNMGARMLNGATMDNAFKGVFTDVVKDKAGKAALDESGKAVRKLNYGKLAGGYIGAAAGARVLGGGGVYRDNSGGTNLMGVPFV